MQPQGFKQFKRFSFRNPKPKRVPGIAGIPRFAASGGGVSPGDINDTAPLPYGGNPDASGSGNYEWHQDPDGNWVPVQSTGGGEPTGAGFPGGGDNGTETRPGYMLPPPEIANEINPHNTPGWQDNSGNTGGSGSAPSGGSGNTYPPGFNNYPGSGSTPFTDGPPLGPYPPLPGVMPDGSYNGPGSGAPTRNLVGLGAGTVANFILPGSGMIISPLAKFLMRQFQGPVGAEPGQEQQQPGKPAGSIPASDGHLASNGYSPTGGIPTGNQWWSGDFGRDLPSAARGQGPGDYNPPGPGGGPGSFGIGNGSFFGGSGNPIVPGSGFLNNAAGSGSMPTLGGRSDYSADQTLHSVGFANTLKNMGYSGLKDFQNQTGFSLPGSQLGAGQGSGRNLKAQNFSGGGVAGQGEEGDDMHPGIIEELIKQGKTLTPEQMDVIYKEKQAEAEARQRNLTNQQDFHRASPTGYAGGGVAGAGDEQVMGADSPELLSAIHRYLEMINEQKRRRAMNEEPSPTPTATPSQDISFARGGMVPRVPPMQQVHGMGTDTVPAALTPGELILNKQQQAAVMPRPGMKKMLKPAELAAIEIAIRKRKGGQSAQFSPPMR